MTAPPKKKDRNSLERTGLPKGVCGYMNADTLFPMCPPPRAVSDCIVMERAMWFMLFIAGTPNPGPRMKLGTQIRRRDRQADPLLPSGTLKQPFDLRATPVEQGPMLAPYYLI